MTHQEFMQRTGVSVDTKEYAAIEQVYMASDLEKDEFCKMWSKMNSSRVKAAKKQAQAAAKHEEQMDKLFDLYTSVRVLHDRERLMERAYKFFTAAQQRLLAELGIEMEERIGGEIFFKELWDVRYEIEQLFAA